MFYPNLTSHFNLYSGFLLPFKTGNVQCILLQLSTIATGEKRLGGEGIEQKWKMTHEHGPQCGDYWGKWGIRRLNGTRKKT